MPSAHVIVIFLVGFVCLVVGVVLIPTLNEILPTVRRMVYKRGYRPKERTILYSPSLALAYAAKKAMDNVVFPTIIYPSPVMGLRNAPGTTYLPMETARKMSPYELARYCVMCSTELNLADDVAKTCPNGCGYIYLGHDDDGLPVITFTT